MSDVLDDPANMWQETPDKEPPELIDIPLPRRSDRLQAADDGSSPQPGSTSTSAVRLSQARPTIPLLESPTPVEILLDNEGIAANLERVRLTEHQGRNLHEIWAEIDAAAEEVPSLSAAAHLFNPGSSQAEELTISEDELRRRDEEDLRQESARSSPRYEEINSYVKREIELYPTEILNFVAQWRHTILSELIAGSKTHGYSSYCWSADGQWLEKAWRWQSAISNVWLTKRDVHGTLVQLLLIPFFTRLRTDPTFILTLQALAAGFDLSHLRILMCLGGPAENHTSSGNYVLLPRAAVDDGLVTRLRQTRDITALNLEQISCVATTFPAYAGTSGEVDVRTGWTSGHRSPSQDAVNSLVRKARAKYGSQRYWHAYLDWNSHTAEHGDLSFGIRHVIEHFTIVAFKLTRPQQAGLNVNCMDRSCWETLLPAVDVQRAARALDTVVREHPDVLLPFTTDQDAWCQLLAPLFPMGTPVTVGYVLESAKGLNTRKKVWDQVPHPHLDSYLTRVPISRIITPRSEHYVVTKGRLRPPPRAPEYMPNNILQAMVETVKAFAVAEGLPALVLPGSAQT